MNSIKLYSLFLLLSISVVTNAHPFTNKAANAAFVENKGQITDQDLKARTDIQFKLSATNGLNIFIGNGEIHYQFSKAESKVEAPSDNTKLGVPFRPVKSTPYSMYRMDVALIGANPNAEVTKEQQQDYYENHYNIGGSNGATANAYSKITYKEIYPHIDWVLYMREGHLKHEFIVKPGGNPGNIQLQYGGATDLWLNNDGSLSATTPQGSITEAAPYSYQTNGKAVSSNYKLHGNVLSFETGDYSGSLTIDPSLVWGTYYGGSSSDFCSALTTDKSGFVYMAGYTQSPDGIATTGAYMTTVSGSSDAFLVKFNAAGNRLWGTYFGGNQEDVVYGLATDTFSHVYVCGYSSSTAGIATAGTCQSTYAGSFSDAYVVQFDTAGNRQWGTYYGGGYMGYDVAYGVAADNNGNVYLTGVTSNSTLISTPGSFQPVYGGGTYNGDAFIVKLDNTGNRVWGTYYGGGNDDFGRSVCVDGMGNLFVSGTTASGGFATTGAHQTTLGGGSQDAFLAKFSGAGARLWSTYYGGNDQDALVGTVADTSGNVYACGYTSSNASAAIASTGAYQTVFGGFSDAMLVKFSSTGLRRWGTYYGGSSTDYATSVAINDSGNIFISGNTHSTNAIATSGAYQTFNAGGSNDLFLTKFNSAGSLLYGTYYGGGGNDAGYAVAVNGTDIYFTGFTESTYGIATPGAYQTINASPSSYEGLLIKFEDCPTMVLTSSTAIPNICDSTLFHYVPTSSLPGATLSWTRDTIAGITNIAASGTDSISETLHNTTDTAITVTYIYTLSSATCSDTQSIHVTVNPKPRLVSSLGFSVCSGVMFSYTALSSIAGSTFTWTRATVAGIVPGASAGTGAITETLINTTPTPITVIYRFIITANGCSTTVPVSVTVLPAPVASSITITGADSVCPGFQITLTATPASGTWHSSSSNATVTGGVVTGVTSGAATISYTITDSCGVNTATLTHLVTVKTHDQCNVGVANTTGNAPQLMVYPNPNNGSFSFQLASATKQDVHIAITNVLGQKVYEGNTTCNTVSTLKIDTPPGIYVLTAITANATYVTQITVR